MILDRRTNPELGTLDPVKFCEIGSTVVEKLTEPSTFFYVQQDTK